MLLFVATIVALWALMWHPSFFVSGQSIAQIETSLDRKGVYTLSDKIHKVATVSVFIPCHEIDPIDGVL